MATPYQMQQMDKLAALEALTKGIVGQYGGGNDVKSVVAQNEAYVQGARQQGLTDAEIAAQVPKLPWNDSTRYIPSQSLMADELGPAPADAVAGGMPAPAPMPAAPVQAAMPVQASAPAPAQRQTFLQRLGQGFDQAATAGLIDPSTLTKEQRRILRGQLLMNIGGALSQNRPVGEGFQQQYNMISTRQADQAAKAKAALTAQQEATRRQIYQNADWSTSEGAQKLVNDLSRAGLYDDAMEVTKNIVLKLSDDYTVMSDQIYGTILVDKTGRRPAKQINIPGATPINEITPYKAATLALDQQKFGLEQQKFAFEQEKAKREAAAKGMDSGYNPRQQVGANAILTNSYNYVEKLTGIPAAKLRTLTPAQIEQEVIKKGRRVFQGPLLGDLPLFNRDLEAYAMGMAQGQASINNPTGQITGPDLDAALRQQPNPRQNVETQARLIRQNIETALGGGKPWPAKRIK